MHLIAAQQIADNIDIKSFRSIYGGEPVYADSDEVFYRIGENQFAYVFRYGVFCCSNFDEQQKNQFIAAIAPSCKNVRDNKFNDQIVVETGAPENKFGHIKIALQSTGTEPLRIIMLNLAQSVAIDYYSDQTENLLEATNQHTVFLEKKGKLDISGRALKRFIGKTLNLRNRITENLYIFDSLPETWENEELYKIDMELKKTFDLQSRYRNIQEELQIIRENLSLLIDLMHQRKSSMLETVVILLILVEVINLFIEKLFD